jgi:hypothetical protein
MIRIEQIKNYFPAQIRENSIFDKYMLKEYLQLMILDYLFSIPSKNANNLKNRLLVLFFLYFIPQFPF